MPKIDNRAIYTRKPINQALNKIWESPLTVVEAPMGYGKTTAVKEFFRKNHAVVLWQTLLDDSVTGLWHGLLRLLRTLDSTTADSLAGLGVPSNSVFLEEAIRIVEDIKFPAKTVIVFDDYHLLSSGDIDKFIELLVKSELPNLHIVIISRHAFGENTTELSLKGYCSVIDKSCFELSPHEIVEYCKLCGVKLNAEETAFLVSYTEGWISAVYLCILGFLQDGRFERQISLYELIEKVIYRHFSAEIQELLLNICIFDCFSLKQAEYIWRNKNAEKLLARLLAENNFIKYDPANRTYYMHNIFTGYLRRIFARLNLDRQQAIWKTAGKWNVSIGEYLHAMDCFYKAGDFDALLSAVEIVKGDCITNGHKELLIRYFDNCPMEIKRDHPRACLIYALNLYSFNEMELFAEQCEEIGDYIELLQGENSQTKAQLAGELEILCSFTKYNNITRMSEYYRRACSLMKGPSDFIDRNGSWTFGSPSVLYMFYRESGQLEQEVHEMNEALPQYCRLTDGHGSGAEYVLQAERYYNIGDFENAEIAAHTALFIAHSQEQAAIELCALFLQLRLALVKGDFGYVMHKLLQTREKIKQQGLYLYIHTWDMCEGFVYAYLDQEQKIPEWIAKGELQASAIYFPSYAFLNIIRGKELLIAGQYLKLIGLSEGFIAIASIFPNLLGQVYIYIYEAAAKFKLGRHEDARITLLKALDIAAPDQVIMPFVENCEYIVDMLNVMEKNGPYPEFIGRILDAFPAIEKNRKNILAELNSSDVKSLLTEREWVIAELVAKGLSNQTIGKTLYIAEVTVKKALQSIFVKLGINTRTALTRIIVEKKVG